MPNLTWCLVLISPQNRRYKRNLSSGVLVVFISHLITEEQNVYVFDLDWDREQLDGTAAHLKPHLKMIGQLICPIIKQERVLPWKRKRSNFNEDQEMKLASDNPKMTILT